MKKHLLAATAVASITLIALSGTAASADPQNEPAAPSAPTVSTSVQDAIDAGATTADAIADAVGLPTEGPASLSTDAAGRLDVTITYSAKPTEAQAAAVAQIAEVSSTNTFTPTISASVEPARLAELSALEGVTSVTTILAPSIGSMTTTLAGSPAVAPRSASATECTPYPSDSSAPLAADLARLDFGVDGSGVKVGILSDSFATNATAASSPEEDILLDAIPGAGNPCGWTTPVEVISDRSGSDEGRTMAQVVHGIAPGAELAFATGGGGPEGMAENIVRLAQGGATVIVDDIVYSDEPLFQQGIISSAIEYVKKNYGVAYYSSAGNYNVIGRGDSAGRPISAWETTAYRPTTCPIWLDLPPNTTGVDCLDFDPSGAAQAWDTLVFDGTTRPSPLLSWGEPVGGVTTQMMAQLYRVDGGNRELVGSSVQIEPETPNASFVFPALASDPPANLSAGTYDLVVVRNTSSGVPSTTPPVWIGSMGRMDSLVQRQFDASTGDDRVGRATFGHMSDGSALGVAAVSALNPGVAEPFSSHGPARMYFAPFDPDASAPAAALNEPLDVASPMIAGIDGARNTFLGGPTTEDGQTVHRFYGTSAAAPSVAAVHALAQSYLGRPDAARIWGAIRDTARPVSNPWAAYTSDEAVFGAGLARTDDALALLSDSPAPTPASVPAALASTGPETTPGIAAAAAAFLIGATLLIMRRRRVRRS